MSKLVLQWENSFNFTEDELAFLADTQKTLSRPLFIPDTEATSIHISMPMFMIDQQKGHRQG